MTGKVSPWESSSSKANSHLYAVPSSLEGGIWHWGQIGEELIRQLSLVKERRRGKRVGADCTQWDRKIGKGFWVEIAYSAEDAHFSRPQT
jgi:hypothetical protein